MRQTHIHRLIARCGPLKWVSNSSSSSSSECLVSVTMTSISGNDDATLYTSASLLYWWLSQFCKVSEVQLLRVWFIVGKSLLTGRLQQPATSLRSAQNETV